MKRSIITITVLILVVLIIRVLIDMKKTVPIPIGPESVHTTQLVLPITPDLNGKGA